MSPCLFDFDDLFAQLRQEGAAGWADQLQQRLKMALADSSHGNLKAWSEDWQSLPVVPDASIDGRSRVKIVGTLPTEATEELRSALMSFHPWRKGPFDLFGIHVDTEWRSDWKWDRLKDHVELRNRSVLDVGSGNGYFGWRMLAAGARRVIGLDPFALYVMQHEVIKRLANSTAPNFVLPVGDECLPNDLKAFDVTFSMGVLYHRSNPIEHLQSLLGSLKTGGLLVLETLIVEGDESTVLVPKGRYAKMRNVWFIPSVELLQLWLRRVGFRDVQLIDTTATSIGEQRSTDWMTFESLPDFLDPENPKLTIEGYPAPLRAIVTCTR